MRSAVLASTLPAARIVRRTWWLLMGRHAGIVALGIVTVVLATYNLELYPTTWFDEGSHLHVPKTFVQEGVYADRSAEGYRYFGPTTGIGPTVLLPIALVFKLAGIGLLQARLVMVAYLLATVALFYGVARWLYGPLVALLATLLLLVTPGVNLLFVGRQVLGEAPALGFLLLGFLAWWASSRRDRLATWLLVLATLSFGLAALTKSQVGLVLAPALCLMGLLDWRYYRQLSPRFYLAPLAGVVGAVAIGLLAQVAIATAATGDALATLRLLRDASGGAIFVFAPNRMLSSLKFLLSPEVFGYWALPGLIYGLVLARERTLRGLWQAQVLAFVGVGLAWYVVGSIGWPRYAFPALALTTLVVAKLIVDVVVTLWQARSGSGGARLTMPALAVAVAIGFALTIVVPLQQVARQIVTTTDRSPQLVAAYLDAHVPHSAVIETWEPELGALTDHRYHYPPSGWLDRSVRARWFGGGGTLTGYDPVAEAAPDLLVVGPFGKYTGIYDAMTGPETSQWLVSYGPYDVYRLRQQRDAR